MSKADIFIGINEGLNASVVALRDGEVAFALQEERITREKEFAGFPHQALKRTLEELGIEARDARGVCLSNLHSPRFTRRQFLDTYDHSDKTIAGFLARGAVKDALRRAYHYTPWLRQMRIAVARDRSNAQVSGLLMDHGFQPEQVRRTHHHSNHAASAYFGLRRDSESPYLIMTLDGGGDGDCSHVYRAEGNQMELLASTPYGHSVGQIYSRMTHLMGFTPHEHEYKLMGLAPYADLTYARPVADCLSSYLGLDPESPLRFKRKTPESTEYLQPRMVRDFAGMRFDSLAGGMQKFCEDLMVDWVRQAIKRTGIGRVLAAGGVFMNVKANKLIAELDEVESFDVFPSCGDETLPFGGVWQAQADHDPSVLPDRGLGPFYLGPSASNGMADAIDRAQGAAGVTKMTDPAETVAALLAQGKIVARSAGRMEFGARALGNRSILADPAVPGVIPRINKMIKQRDFWMPFAPIILQDCAEDYVRVSGALPRPVISPYMMHTFDSRPEKRGEFPGALHPYDETARAQVLCLEMNPDMHRLLSRYRERTGRGVLLNTSFNLHGSPVVMNATDAIDVFLNSGLDYLVIDDHLFTKALDD